MPRFEYKVVPAPRRAEKVKGVKAPTDRFAHALSQMMNELGRDGWEYLRAETLPCEERVGFTGKTTTFQNLLIFRRVQAVEAASGAQPPEVQAVFRPDRPPEPAELAATLRPRPIEPEPGLRAPPVQAPQGQAPAIGPARGGLAAE